MSDTGSGMSFLVFPWTTRGDSGEGLQEASSFLGEQGRSPSSLSLVPFFIHSRALSRWKCVCVCVCVSVCESVVRMLQESRKEDRPDGSVCPLWSTHVASLPFAHESKWKYSYAAVLSRATEFYSCLEGLSKTKQKSE